VLVCVKARTFLDSIAAGQPFWPQYHLARRAANQNPTPPCHDRSAPPQPPGPSRGHPSPASVFAKSTKIIPPSPASLPPSKGASGLCDSAFSKEGPGFRACRMGSEGERTARCRLSPAWVRSPSISDLGDAPPLLMAAVNGHNEVVKALITAGARGGCGSTRRCQRIDAGCSSGQRRCCVNTASDFRRVRMQMPRTKMAGPRLCSQLKASTLCRHAKLQRTIIKTLLAFGGDPLIKNRSGDTALDDVRLIMDKETKRLLESARR
jgi:hypothetical protein